MTKDKQVKEEHEFKEMLKNAATKCCPDCGCEKVERFEPLSEPDNSPLQSVTVTANHGLSITKAYRIPLLRYLLLFSNHKIISII